MSTAIAAGVDIAATATALVALVALHLLPTGLSPLRDPVSQYGITAYRTGYRVLTVALGVAGLASASGIVTASSPGSAGTEAVTSAFAAAGRGEIALLLAIFGACRLVISWAPMDAPGRPRTTTGSIHVVLAIGAFLAAGIAANRMHRALGASGPPADAMRGALVAAFWLIAIGLAGQVVLRRATPLHTGYGAAERLVYAGIFVLLGATGIALT